MLHYSTGHDHAAPAPDTKYEHRMRYPKRAQSPASPGLDRRSLPPGELPPRSLPPGVLPPGSLPPGIVPPRPVPDRSTRPTRPPPADKPINDDHFGGHRNGEEYRKAINRPPVPSTVINVPYVNHDDKMQYPKPAPSAARHRPHNIWGTCNKPGGCNKHVEDEPPPVPTTMNPVNPSVQTSLDNHARKTGSEPWAPKWVWFAASLPFMAIGCALLCATVEVGKNRRKNKGGDEEEPEDED